jgi:hypothetical protein
MSLVHEKELDDLECELSDITDQIAGISNGITRHRWLRAEGVSTQEAIDYLFEKRQELFRQAAEVGQKILDVKAKVPGTDAFRERLEREGQVTL